MEPSVIDWAELPVVQPLEKLVKNVGPLRVQTATMNPEQNSLLGFAGLRFCPDVKSEAVFALRVVVES